MKFKLIPEHLQNYGHCQVTYWTKNNQGEKIFYAFQDNFGIKLVRCSQDYEPQWNATLKPEQKASDLFERPKGDSWIEKQVRDYLDKN